MKPKMYVILVVAIALGAFFIYNCGVEGEMNQVEDPAGKNIVGGECKYQEFSGNCTWTEKNNEGVYFTYSGTVNGHDVTLEKNKADGVNLDDLNVGGSFDCRLGFITSGTCTPCLFLSDAFTTGECGTAAWDLFREM